jgi:hypothetical protein
MINYLRTSKLLALTVLGFMALSVHSQTKWDLLYLIFL